MVTSKIVLPLLFLALGASIDLHGANIFTFTKKIIEKLLTDPHDWETNILFSPFSLELALGIVGLGASGETFQELIDLAGTHLIEVSEHEHGYAKRILGRMSQLSEGKINVKLQAGAVLALNSNNMPYKKFLDDARRWYKVELQPLNFDWSELASVNISDYIADKTSGRINNLVLFKDVNDNAPLMVVSYLDVTSKWLTRFDDKSTLMGQFHTINGEYELKYMINGEFYANITHNLDLEAKILRLPLQGGNLSMTFVLPDKKQGIHKLQRKLRKNLDSLWSDNSKYSFELLRTHITLPKFKIEHKLNAKKVLNQLGVNKIFEPDAELQNLAEGNGLCLTGITQKSVISVDEWGINAVSADHIKSDDDYQDEMIEEEEDEERKMVPIEEFFIADRPFFFTLTIQPTDDVLFFGLYGGN